MEQMQGDRNSQISIIEDRAHVQNNKAHAILKGIAQANPETVAKQSFNAHYQFIRLILQDKSVFGGVLIKGVSMKTLLENWGIFCSKLEKVKQTSNGIEALCPAHDDKNASLTASLNGEKILFKCQAGCVNNDILQTINMEWNQFFVHSDNSKTQRKKEVCRYSYENKEGKHAFDVVRFEPKDFRPQRPDGKWSLEGVERVPYSLPELLQGVTDSKTTLLLEGEKDVDSAMAMGLIATTFVGGAGKWREEYLEYFRGADVVLIPDNDDPGLKGMTEIATKLHGTASRIRMLELPGLGPRQQKHGKDFSDWAELEENTKDTLEKIISDLPEWSPEHENEFDVLNGKHFVTRIGGKTIVVNEDYDPAMERQILTYSSPTDFKNFYSNQFVPVEARHVPLGTFWFNNPDRRQYKGITFMPGESSPYKGNYNLWGGFSVDAIRSNSENPHNIEAFSWFYDHICQNIANGDDLTASYVIGWMADLVQYPRKRLGVSLVLRSDAQGTGKGLFARILGHLFGKHYLHITNPRHLTGNFNAHLIDCLLLFADEAFWAGDKSSEGALKTLITEEFRAVEIKGKDVFQTRNFTRLLIASNKSWVVPSELHDRRFVILDVNPRRARDTKYFGSMIKQMENGGYEALLWYLMNLKIDIDLRNCMPDTDAMRDSKVYSMSPVQMFWHECLVEGEFETGNRWEEPHNKRILHESFKEQSKKNEHTSREVFMKELKKIVDFKETRIHRERSLIFAPLEECRDDFEERYGIKITEPV